MAEDGPKKNVTGDEPGAAEVENPEDREPTIQDLTDNLAAAEARERRLNQQEADEAAAEHEKGALEGAHEEVEEARKALAEAQEKQTAEDEKAKK